jgi:two-component system, NarL family, response regulator
MKEMGSVMKAIVISKHAILREGLVSVISKQDNITLQFVGESIKEAMFMIRGNKADILLLGVCDEDDQLDLINEIRISTNNIKQIILDFNDDNNLFVKALKCGVHGYISGKSSEDELLYVINQISKGTKYFDSRFVDSVINGEL